MNRHGIDSRLFDAEGRMPILDGMRYYKKTREENNVPRFLVTMKADVDRSCLQHAAEKAMGRFRVQRMRVVQDAARFYLQENPAPPVVHADDGSRHSLCTPDNNGHMFWIGCRGKEITIEFFHGVSDGSGMLPFIRTLLYYYCAEKYGGMDDELPGLILADTPEDPREYTEAVRFLPEKAAEATPHYRWEQAFQLSGRQMEDGSACKAYVLTVDGAAFEAYMRANGSSRSALFAMFMNHAIYASYGLGDEPIVGALAVDARRAYGAEGTLQCCVATIPLWLDREILSLPMGERFRCGRKMILDGAQRERILAAGQKARAMNLRMEAQCPTLEEKKAFCRTMNDAGSTKYSYGISYVGEIRFGEAIDRHVNRVRTQLCANSVPVILEITKTGGNYHISYCSHFEEDPCVHAFRQMFIDAGIPCELRQEADYTESFVDF